MKKSSRDRRVYTRSMTQGIYAITNKVKKMVGLQFQLIVLRLQFFLVYSGLIDRRSIANKILWELQKLFD
jgi:hypothetical protein